MRWTDIDDIVELLEEKYPNEDLITLRFTDLYNWIINLEGFDDDKNRSNEKILEAIQANWIEYREDNK